MKSGVFIFYPFCFIEKRIRLKKGFLINGGILPGSSGSPVILKQSHYRQIGNEILYDNFLPILLCIVSETRFVFTTVFTVLIIIL